ADEMPHAVFSRPSVAPYCTGHPRCCATRRYKAECYLSWDSIVRHRSLQARTSVDGDEQLTDLAAMEGRDLRTQFRQQRGEPAAVGERLVAAARHLRGRDRDQRLTALVQ